MARTTASSSHVRPSKRRPTKRLAASTSARTLRSIQTAKQAARRVLTKLKSATQRVTRLRRRASAPARSARPTPPSKPRLVSARKGQMSAPPQAPRRSRVVLKESAKHQPTRGRTRPRQAPKAVGRLQRIKPSVVAPSMRGAEASVGGVAASVEAARHAVEAPPPSPQRGSVEDSFVIPTGYGDHRIVLMVKDPWWLFAYWEIQPGVERKVRSQLAPDEVGGLQSILRVYDVTDRDFPKEAANGWVDIPLSGLATNWYLHVNAPNRSFVVDIGLLTRQGRFLLLARSNRVTTPRFGPSDVVDEEWMTTDENYWKLFGLTAGVGMGSSASALKEVLERKLGSPGLFSPGVFSPTNAQHAKPFGLSVDAELIVHGATDSKAAVTVQGQAVKLRSDGTFSVRMAFPDGSQTIPVEATSPDKRQTRAVTTTISRKTDGQTTAEHVARQQSARQQ